MIFWLTKTNYEGRSQINRTTILTHENLLHYANTTLNKEGEEEVKVNRWESNQSSFFIDVIISPFCNMLRIIMYNTY